MSRVTNDRNEGNGSAGGGAGGDPSTPSATRLAVSLEGKLPCAFCGYDLRGVSILGVCPECGTAVRATLLAVVDPLASELRPVRRPRMVAAGLLIWVGTLCVGAVVVGGALIRQLLAASNFGETLADPWWLAWVVGAVALAAATGAALLVKPHEVVNRRETLMTWIAVGLHVPLAVAGIMLSRLEPHGWGGGGSGGGSAIGPMAVIWDPSPGRSALRMIAGVAGLGIIVCMRPVARALVARSLAIRTGRVDRQTMLATGAAIVVVMAGDLLGLGGRSIRGGAWGGSTGSAAADWMLIAAVTLTGLGALLLCLGLFSSLVDSVRIAQAIVRPGPSIQQILHGRRETDRPAAGSPPGGPRRDA